MKSRGLKSIIEKTERLVTSQYNIESEVIQESDIVIDEKEATIKLLQITEKGYFVSGSYMVTIQVKDEGDYYSAGGIKVKGFYKNYGDDLQKAKNDYNKILKMVGLTKQKLLKLGGFDGLF